MKQAAQLCCVTIGYDNFLMPAGPGMKVVELMQQAIICHKHFEDRDYQYDAGDQPRVSFELVKPARVHMPDGQAITPARPVVRRLKG